MSMSMSMSMSMLCDVERFDGAARVADCPGALGADEVALPALRLDENGDALGVDVDPLVRVDESFAVVGRKLRREPNRRENVIVILVMRISRVSSAGVELTSISKMRDLRYAESSTAYTVDVPEATRPESTPIPFAAAECALTSLSVRFLTRRDFRNV